MNIIFPKTAGGLPRQEMHARYYKTYYGYVLESLKNVRANVEFCSDTSIGECKFKMYINDIEIVIDYSDFLTLADNHSHYPFYFKFHHSENIHDVEPNLFAFSPTSFYDWNQYNFLKNELIYSCNSNIILNRQVPYGNATVRRKKVQLMLLNQYKSDVQIKRIDQVAFWKEIKNCLVSVCVPGGRPNMLDRGQFQYMALGACTISPYIINNLPYNKKLIPGIHYICCKDDYSDLIDKIEWCKSNRNKCIEIGQNAQQLFLETSTPEKLWEWVEINLNR